MPYPKTLSSGGKETWQKREVGEKNPSRKKLGKSGQCQTRRTREREKPPAIPREKLEFRLPAREKVNQGKKKGFTKEKGKEKNFEEIQRGKILWHKKEKTNRGGGERPLNLNLTKKPYAKKGRPKILGKKQSRKGERDKAAQ